MLLAQNVTLGQCGYWLLCVKVSRQHAIASLTELGFACCRHNLCCRPDEVNDLMRKFLATAHEKSKLSQAEKVKQG